MCLGSLSPVSHPSSHVLKAVAEAQVRKKMEIYRLLEAQAHHRHIITSTLFCWPKQATWSCPKLEKALRSYMAKGVGGRRGEENQSFLVIYLRGKKEVQNIK